MFTRNEAKEMAVVAALLVGTAACLIVSYGRWFEPGVFWMYIDHWPVFRMPLLLTLVTSLAARARGSEPPRDSMLGNPINYAVAVIPTTVLLLLVPTSGGWERGSETRLFVLLLTTGALHGSALVYLRKLLRGEL